MHSSLQRSATWKWGMACVHLTHCSHLKQGLSGALALWNTEHNPSGSVKLHTLKSHLCPQKFLTQAHTRPLIARLYVSFQCLGPCLVHCFTLAVRRNGCCCTQAKELASLQRTIQALKAAPHQYVAAGNDRSTQPTLHGGPAARTIAPAVLGDMAGEDWCKADLPRDCCSGRGASSTLGQSSGRGDSQAGVLASLPSGGTHPTQEAQEGVLADEDEVHKASHFQCTPCLVLSPQASVEPPRVPGGQSTR